MYDIGDVNVLSVLVTDTSGVAANCTAVVLTVTLPDGSTSTPTVLNPQTGTYQANFTITQAGEHRVSWVGTGANAAAFTDTFYVQAFASLVSLAEAKAHLNLTSTTNDEELRSKLVAITAACESYSGRTFRQRTFTRTFSPEWTGPETLLLEVDATAITSVTENGVTLTAGTQYSLDDAGVLWRKGSAYSTRSWLSGHDNVVVVYTRGSTTVPADLREAVLEYVRDDFGSQRGPGGGMAPGGAVDDAYQPNTQSLPPRIRSILDNLTLGGMG